MNVKQLLCLTLAASVGTQALATEIYKGKLISEKIWATQGDKAAVKAASHAGAMKRQPQSSGYTDTNASITSGTAKVGETVEIGNNHHFFADNNGNVARNYDIIHTVCSEDSNKMEHCVHSFKSFEIQPGGYVNENLIPSLKMRYTAPGEYKITAYSSYVYDHHHASTLSQAFGKMIVTQ